MADPPAERPANGAASGPAPAPPGIDPGRLERMVEALLFASVEPVPEAELAAVLPAGAGLRAALAALEARYRDRGVRLCRVAGGWAFRTAPEHAGLFERRVEQRRRLSRAAIETLAIIAYHQPATRAEVEAIRGVAVSRGTIHRLMEEGWVALGRRRNAPGRPVTYVVTPAFLDHFGLASARDLPGLGELKALGLLQPAAAPEPPGAPDRRPDAADGTEDGTEGEEEAGTEGKPDEPAATADGRRGPPESGA